MFMVHHCLASDLDANLPMSLTFFGVNHKAYSTAQIAQVHFIFLLHARNRTRCNKQTT